MEPTLVILAAGMGSRFGGLKQITAVDEMGHAIIDYSMFDAYRAGFRKVCFIIKHEIEDDFKASVGKRMEKVFDVQYVYQQLDCLPEGYSVPEGRVKPWGTAHAVLCCAGTVEGPFAVINADDFYGPSAFAEIHDFLVSGHPAHEYAMVGYRVENTLTENGHVARGVCQLDATGRYLTGITERTHIEPREGGAAFTEDDGKTFTFLPAGTIVSMNLWGFTPDILSEIEGRFAAFLQENLPKNPLKCEYFLPLIPNALIHEGKGSVRVLSTHEKWYGVTYHDDMPKLQAALAGMRADGVYPEGLWRD